MNKNHDLQNIKLSDADDAVIIVDQTKLPGRLVYLSVSSPEECFDAIKKLQVRGAPAIGIFAGYSMYVLMRSYSALAVGAFLEKFDTLARYLQSSRPTAVNLAWAITRMRKIVLSNSLSSPAEILKVMREEAIAIHREDIAMCKKISENGLSLLSDGNGILTHCNAGPLATSGYGTALGPMFLGKKRGMRFHVFADETRPLLQGARLTAYELYNAGIDVTLICDNMASTVMKQGKIDAVFVGCDRIAANGDFANKIGTSGVAILAKHYGIPFYTLGPSSTIDLAIASGDEIEIEERDPDEIKTMWYKTPMAPEGVKAYNPAFDVTDHSLLSGIVTEKGVIHPPFDKNLKNLF